jgi:hypothetical protein
MILDMVMALGQVMVTLDHMQEDIAHLIIRDIDSHPNIIITT